MATTSIWAVKGWLGQVVVYAKNPEKTQNPNHYRTHDITAEQTQGLFDVIDYASQSYKTQVINENIEIMERFISGVNCRPETARNEMMAVKAHFGKKDGVVAYHGYQSFAPGEVTPEIAHTIGIKLAEKLWGEKYQVLVTTHLDKAHHLHNHFVVNNVSMIDGKKYYRSNSDYYKMQRESDALCREYGLSVIEEPERGRSKHYAEWNAEKNGRQTWRGLVKTDVDTAIRQSMTDKQFFDNLRKMGYDIKVGNDISVRPPGKERFVRMRRNFGDDYDIEGIKRRILAQNRPERKNTIPERQPKKVKLIGRFHKARRITGLRALYFYYLYRMGVLPKKRQPNPKKVYFLFREDIRYIQNISRETRLLVKYGIDTAEQLADHKESIIKQISELYGNRKHLRNKVRSIKEDEKLLEVKSEIAHLSSQIKDLRREVRLCEDIEIRSGVIKDKLHKAREAELAEKLKTKEVKKDESFRRRR